jgi:hypothetical protein
VFILGIFFINNKVAHILGYFFLCLNFCIDFDKNGLGYITEDPGLNPARVYVRSLGKTEQCCRVLLTQYALFFELKNKNKGIGPKILF